MMRIAGCYFFLSDQNITEDNTVSVTLKYNSISNNLEIGKWKGVDMINIVVSGFAEDLMYDMYPHLKPAEEAVVAQ